MFVSTLPLPDRRQSWPREAEAMLRAAGASTRAKRECVVKTREKAGYTATRIRSGEKPDRETIADALNHIPNDCDYDEWVKIGFALYDGLGEGGRDLWEAWSATSPRNEPDLTAKKWPSFAQGRTVTVATLFRHALQHGWRARESSTREGKARRATPGETRQEGSQSDPSGGDGSARPKTDHLAALNDKYCVVRDGGKTRVLTFEPHRQKQHTREVPTYWSFEDFRNFHLNRQVRVSEDKKIPLGHWWLKHPERRQYEGVTFEPGAGEVVDGRLNLWRGWGVEPKPGVWTRMRRHIDEVLANGDEAAADYIIKWVAWAFQHPAERAQAALVFKGGKGAGKGTLGNELCHIFGQHGTHISSADHLAGRFNGHLRDACLLFADEAYWPGDKGAEGSLKRLVTEPDLFIEAKGRDGVSVANMLHIIMASNEDWIVPAGEDERRYAVFGVSDAHMQDEAWFKPIYAEMEAGGEAAMLYDLLRLDLGDWHPRRIPKTAGLLEQQSQSLRPADAWWVELLQSGWLAGADDRKPNCAVSNYLFDQAREISPRLKLWSDHLLGQYLTKQGCSNTRKVSRRRGWEFPPLPQLRTEWERRYPGWCWDDPELLEWQAENRQAKNANVPF